MGPLLVSGTEDTVMKESREYVPSEGLPPGGGGGHTVNVGQGEINK